MTKINWTKTEYYEWEGISEKSGYSILVIQTEAHGRWYWKIYNNEDCVQSSTFEDEGEDYFDNSIIARASAAKALTNYLKEKTIV